jgi:tetrahydromethanopterin S-methyltransferase subunit G
VLLQSTLGGKKMDERETIQDVRERLVRIETLIETKLGDADQRIRKLEDTITWLWRTVIGGFISAAIAIYMKK